MVCCVRGNKELVRYEISMRLFIVRKKEVTVVDKGEESGVQCVFSKC